MLYFSPILGEGPHGHPLQSPAPSRFLDPFGVGLLVSTVRLHPLCSFGKVSVNSCCDALPILGEVTLSCPPTPFLGLLGVGELVSTRHYALPTIVCAPSPSLPSRCGALIFIRCTFLEGRGGVIMMALPSLSLCPILLSFGAEPHQSLLQGSTSVYANWYLRYSGNLFFFSTFLDGSAIL